MSSFGTDTRLWLEGTLGMSNGTPYRDTYISSEKPRGAPRTAADAPPAWKDRHPPQVLTPLSDASIPTSAGCNGATSMRSVADWHIIYQPCWSLTCVPQASGWVPSVLTAMPKSASSTSPVTGITYVMAGSGKRAGGGVVQLYRSSLIVFYIFGQSTKPDGDGMSTHIHEKIGYIFQKQQETLGTCSI